MFKSSFMINYAEHGVILSLKSYFFGGNLLRSDWCISGCTWFKYFFGLKFFKPVWFLFCFCFAQFMIMNLQREYWATALYLLTALIYFWCSNSENKAETPCVSQQDWAICASLQTLSVLNKRDNYSIIDLLIKWYMMVYIPWMVSIHCKSFKIVRVYMSCYAYTCTFVRGFTHWLFGCISTVFKRGNLKVLSYSYHFCSSTKFKVLLWSKCSVWTLLIRYAKHKFENLKAQNSCAAY